MLSKQFIVLAVWTTYPHIAWLLNLGLRAFIGFNLSQVNEKQITFNREEFANDCNSVSQ